MRRLERIWSLKNTSWTILRYKTIYSFCKGNYQVCVKFLWGQKNK